jgi:hypothetical protein
MEKEAEGKAEKIMTPEQEAKFQARFDAENEEQADPRFTERLAREKAETQEKLVNPVGSTLAGSGAALGVGRLINAFESGAGVDVAKLAKEFNVPPNVIAKGDNAVINYIKAMHVGDVNYVGGESYKEAHALTEKAKEMARNAPAGFKYDPTAQQYIPESEYETRAAARAKAEQRNKPMTTRIVEKSPAAGRAVLGAQNLLKRGLPPFVGRTAAGGFGGYSGAEAYNRAIQGDVPGAAISGTGALGALSSLSGNPKARALGLLGMGASALANQFYDSPTESPDVVPSAVKSVMQGFAGGGIAKYAKGKAIKGGLESLKKFNLGDLEGKTLIGTMSDRTAVDLARGLRGGPLFPTIHKGAAWAVDDKGAASRILNAMQAAGGPEKTVLAPMLMSPGAHRSNRDVAKMALQEFQKNYEAGQFSPERLAEIEASVRKVKGLGSHPGLMDPNAANMFDKMTFGQRGALVDWLGSKPKKAPALYLDRLLRETTEPGIEGAELGAIGPTLMKLSGERSIDPSLHGSYSHILHGEMLGGMNPIPREFVYRDLEAKAMKELGRPLSDYNYRTSVGIPSQFVDEKLLRSWEELGYMNPKTSGVNNPN